MKVYTILEIDSFYFFRTKVLTNVKKYGIISYVVDKYADVAELADARDLKSRGKKFPYRFDPGHRHQMT